MTALKKSLRVVYGLLGIILLLFVLSRIWPMLALSLLRQGMQTGMHCWVKVLDQDNKGVKGYKCRVVEEHAPFWPFSTGQDVVRVFETGDDGSFEYTSKGRTGRVFFGYSWGSQWNLNPQNVIQRRDLAVSSLAYQRGIKDNPAGYLGSKGNPYLLHVFTVGPPQKLLCWKKRIKLEHEDSYACIDLLGGRIWESRVPEGDIAIKDNPKTAETAQRQCFSSIVAAANCGVAPVLDDWGLCPPENGYQLALCVPKDWEARHWSSNGVQVYYQLRKEGAEDIAYGRLHIDTWLTTGANVESYTNLQGERNLFYKGYTDLMDQKILDFVSPPVQ